MHQFQKVALFFDCESYGGQEALDLLTKDVLVVDLVRAFRQFYFAVGVDTNRAFVPLPDLLWQLNWIFLSCPYSSTCKFFDFF